jgi:hypothetical protein
MPSLFRRCDVHAFGYSTTVISRPVSCSLGGTEFRFQHLNEEAPGIRNNGKSQSTVQHQRVLPQWTTYITSVDLLLPASEPPHQQHRYRHTQTPRNTASIPTHYANSSATAHVFPARPRRHQSWPVTVTGMRNTQSCFNRITELPSTARLDCI